jgi:hypothetical protein
MSDHEPLEPDLLALQLDAIVEPIKTIAKSCRGDSIKLLALLRTLERLHQEIRETFFQESLPDSRQALYALLKDIETQGGWPYIYRFRLQTLLKNLAEDVNPETLAAETPHHAHECKQD